MATKLIIDGYNFLWQESMFRNEAIRGHDKGRESVLNWLKDKPILSQFDIYLIYDAYKTDSFHPTEENHSGIKVIFTAGGQSADDLIRQMAADEGPSAIVVSSDHEVMRFAEKRGCGVLGSREFQRAVTHPEDFEMDPSRKLPKAKRKALAKLIRLVDEE